MAFFVILLASILGFATSGLAWVLGRRLLGLYCLVLWGCAFYAFAIYLRGSFAHAVEGLETARHGAGQHLTCFALSTPKIE